MKKPWSGPVDMNEDTSAESISILQYFDVTTPPPKGSKLSKFRPSKRHRRLSLEMHRIPTDMDTSSLDLADVFPDMSSHTNEQTHNKAYFRISKYVPMMKNGQSDNIQDDNSTIISDVSARTKEMYSKPDHEWRTKFLLQVCRVAITEIKNEKEVFFEAWDNNGEVIERSLVFKTVGEAKEFSYDLERLANEDPEINNDSRFTNTSPHDMIIRTPLKDGRGRSIETVEEDAELGLNHDDTQLSRSECGCCKSVNCVVATLLHIFGLILALSLYSYGIVIYYLFNDPLIGVAQAFFSMSLFILMMHLTGMIGVCNLYGCGRSFISVSCFFSILSIIINGLMLILFTEKEDDIFDYLKNNHEKLYLSESEIEYLHTHTFWVYFFIGVGTLTEVLR